MYLRPLISKKNFTEHFEKRVKRNNRDQIKKIILEKRSLFSRKGKAQDIISYENNGDDVVNAPLKFRASACHVAYGNIYGDKGKTAKQNVI